MAEAEKVAAKPRNRPDAQPETSKVKLNYVSSQSRPSFYTTYTSAGGVGVGDDDGFGGVFQ